jgi:hypothetical protein
MATRRILQAASLVVVLGAIALWLFTGANRGWTKTSVQLKSVDPVTGLDEIRWKKQFVPGVDFLWGAILGGGILAGVSLLFRSRKQKTEN